MGPLADGRRPRDRGARSPRCVLWAHDHHALLASRTRRSHAAGLDRRHAGPAPAASSAATRRGRRTASCTRRRPRGSSRSTSRRWRPRTSSAAIVAVAQELLALGVVAVHDPGHVSPDPDLGLARSRPMPACPRRAACRSGSIASIRDDGLDDGARGRAAQRRHPRRRPRSGVPGSAGRSASRTARSARGRQRSSPTSNRSPTGRSRPRSRGAASGSPSPRRCASSSTAPRRAGSRPRSTRSATPRSGPRSTRWTPTAGAVPVHAQDRARPAASTRRTRPRFAAAGHRGQRPARPPRVGRGSRRDGCGATAPSGTATPGARSPRPGRSSPSGPTRRSSRSTRGRASPWPSGARIRRWPAGTPAFGPDEALLARPGAARRVRRPGRLRRASAIAAG